MIQKRIHSFKYAINGFIQVAKSEINMQIHLVASVLVVVLSLYLSLSNIEFAIILTCIGLVFMAEIFNTVIEKYLDFYHPERSEKVGILKDMSAAAVLVVSMMSAMVGLLIFVPKILEQL